MSALPRHSARRYQPDLAAGREGLSLLWGRQGSWQVRLRWAVAPLTIAAVAAGRLLGFELQTVPILIVALASVAYNAILATVFSRFRGLLEADPKLDRVLTTAGVMIDYAAMFLLIYLTGGAESPLSILLIFHVILAAIQFSSAAAYALAALAGGGLWLLLLGQLGGWLPGFPISYRGALLTEPLQPAHAVLVLIIYTATLFLAAGLVSRIRHRLRGRVGDLAEATGELARAHRQLETLMRERTEFMLEVAHNLRAPIDACLSIVELLTAGYLGEVTSAQDEHLERLQKRLQALDQTIGELLAIARTRDRSQPIEEVLVDLGALARQTEETFRGSAERGKLRFEVVASERLPKLASGRGLLERLMENLVSNAIKYTPSGGSVRVRFSAPDANSVRIEVEDTGIGIPSAEQGRLFREFFRASNARRRTRLGTGLGLVLVKQTVERLGGDLDLASEEGAGTRVTVTLPLERDRSAPAAETP